MIIILIIAAVISIIVEPGDWIDSLIIVIVVMMNAILGVVLESHAEKSLESLQELSAPQSKVLRDGVKQTIASKELVPGDIIILETGDMIPSDARLIEAYNLKVDESALTGESIPVDKTVNDTVSGATLNQSGFIKVRATRVGEDTTLSQIIQMVSDAASTKAPIAKKADQVSGIFVPVIIGIALVTFIVWMILGK